MGGAALTIRPATVDDLPTLLRMAESFVAETSYRGKLRPDSTAVLNLVNGLMAHGLMLIAYDGLGACSGMLGAMHHINPMTGESTANELAFWLDPGLRSFGYASALLTEFEAWAASKGATVWQLSAPAGPQGERVGRLYGRRGYEPLETTYQRRVS